MGGFIAALRIRERVVTRALEFSVLTAARSGEVLGARWPEVDLDGAVWIVPKERMKAGKAQRVPLSPSAAVLLHALLSCVPGLMHRSFPASAPAAHCRAWRCAEWAAAI